MQPGSLALFLGGTYRSIFRSETSHRLKKTIPAHSRKTRSRTVKSTTTEAFIAGWAKFDNEDSVDEFETKDGANVGNDEKFVVEKTGFEDGTPVIERAEEGTLRDGSNDGTCIEDAEEGALEDTSDDGFREEGAEEGTPGDGGDDGTSV